MKRGLLVVLVLVAVGAALLNTGGNNLTGAATGKLLTSKRVVSLTSIKGFDPKGERIAQLNSEAAVDLAEALEGRGAKVNVAEFSQEDISALRIQVDGQELPPFIVGCKTCEVIVFEY
jgi:hypothetical protein